MKKSLILFLIVSIYYSWKNDKIANKHIPTSDVKESNYVEQTKVLTLGTFHFKFQNIDVAKTDVEDQIDVLDSKYQKEIGLIVDKLVKFKPTKIVIEREPEKQQTYDSLYTFY